MFNKPKLALVIGALLLAIGPHQTKLQAADQIPPEPILAPSGNFAIVVTPVPGDEQYAKVTIVSHRNKRIEHRLMPQKIEGTTDTDETGFSGTFHISPDEKWIFRQAKYVHTIGIGCLYKKHGEADFRPAMPLRFDEAAWRYFASRRGHKMAVPKIEEGPRIIDFIGWSPDSRLLMFRLRPIKGYTAKQGYGWAGVYNTATGKFGSLASRQPGEMQAMRKH